MENLDLKNRLLGFVLILTLALGTVVACSDEDGDDSSQQGSESAYCGDLNELETAVDDVGSLSSSSSLNDVSAALNSVKTAFNDVKSSAQQSANADVSSIQSAVDNLESTIASASSSGSISAAATSIQTARAQLATARADASLKANCGQ